MKNLNEWCIATAINGHEIYVKVIPLKRIQNSIEGHHWVEVGKMIQLQSGEQIEFNLDRKSFYVSYNRLYKLN